MSYYIKVVINGKEDRLNKVAPPTFLMAETYDFVRKSMLKSYVCSNFRDIMNSSTDLQKAEYMKGKKVLLSYTYP